MGEAEVEVEVEVGEVAREAKEARVGGQRRRKRNQRKAHYYEG